MRIHHIGYLIKNMDRAVLEFEQLGFVCEDLPHDDLNCREETVSAENKTAPANCVFDESRQCKIVFMKNDTYRIELVEPEDKNSPIYGLMKKYKNSPYHICYSTDNIETSISTLEESGWVLFEAPQPAPAINNCNVAFLMGAGIGMIELVEDGN